MKSKNIIIGIVMCLMAAILGYGFRYLRESSKKDDEQTYLPEYTYEITYEPTSTPEQLKDNEQRYYTMSIEDYCYEMYDEVSKPQTSVIDEGFIYPEFQNYVLQDDGTVSVGWQDLIDSRSENDHYQFHDYYFVYTGKTSLINNNDTNLPYKLIPYDETNEEFMTADFGNHYLQVEGEIENIDVINDALRKISLTDAGSLQSVIYIDDEGLEFLNDVKTEGCWDVYAHSDAYVLYNDDKLISIGVYMQNSNASYSIYPIMKSININVETGEVLDFDYFVKPDMSLVNSFKAECKKQYPDLDMVNTMDDDELLSYFKGKGEYPPIVIAYDDHLEVGINYHVVNYIGFVTLDFDYEDYPQMNPLNK